MAAFAGGKVNHLDGVVPQRGDEKTIAFDIDGEMIEPASHTGQWNGLREFQWRGTFGRVRRKTHRDREQHGGAFHGDDLGYLVPKLKSSKSVTLSAFVQTPTFPASLKVSSCHSKAFLPSSVTVKRLP